MSTPPTAPLTSDSDAAPPPMPPVQPRPADRGPPRIAGVIGIVALGAVAAVGFQTLGGCLIGVFMGLSAALSGSGLDFDDPMAAAEQIMASPLVFTILIIAGELGFLIVVLVASGRSSLSRIEQFGLRGPGITWYTYVPLFLATILMAIVGTVLSEPIAERFGSMMDVSGLRQATSGAQMVIFLLAISIAPGVVEELFLRGYVQRRLLRRLRPRSAVLLASVLFALIHVDPIHVVFAFPIGVWFGVIAWRTGSIWPSAVCHGLLNGLWNLWFIGVEQEVIPSTVEGVTYECFILLGILGLFGGIAILRRLEPPLPAGPSVFVPVAKPVVTLGGELPVVEPPPSATLPYEVSPGAVNAGEGPDRPDGR